ncbi:GntR family transcriptional regulator [Parasphaerochaeta coccoides]|uniref:GntR family transcriptional regulator n=1 Tax=Parasphaerochaeta coccoides TaxID=273376 RepID=UPI0002F7E6A1|nr:GntR family transcriptional regulator [Parasphaerochaeta coccoides]
MYTSSGKKNLLTVNSLTNQTYDLIKEDILTGRICWNERLDIPQLSERFGVSRSPIIKAIEKLEHENLVVIIPNKGSFVVCPTEKDINEAYEIRVMVEETNCELAFQKNREKLIKELDDIEQEKKRNREKGWNYDYMLYYDRLFHNAIASCADNQQLYKIYTSVRCQTDLFMSKSSITRNESIPIEYSHDTILENLKKEDLSSVLRLMRVHLRQNFNDSILALNKYLAKTKDM